MPGSRSNEIAGKETTMLKIRLRRMGARNSPHYRIVVSDSRSTARAEVLEELGSYDPKREPTVISFDRERARYWIGMGANVSPTVRSLLDRKPAAPAPAEVAAS
jgi:small subunit ribosomal protein S16